MPTPPSNAVSMVAKLLVAYCKSHAVVFGKMHKHELPPIYLGGTTVDWCSSIKYLGVNLLGGRSLKFDTMPTKRAFYSACNSIFMYRTAAGELVLLTLQESYSPPVLMYAIPALLLKSRQVDELNVCWNNVFRRIFNYNKWESVKAVILGLGRLNLKHLIMLRKINFTDICIHIGQLHAARRFWTFLLRDGDEMVKTIFVKKSTALKCSMINMNRILSYYLVQLLYVAKFVQYFASVNYAMRIVLYYMSMLLQ